MEKNIYLAQANPFISSQNRINGLVHYLNTSKELYLRKEFLSSPEFIQYLLTNPNAIKKNNMRRISSIQRENMRKKNPSLEINIPALPKINMKCYLKKLKRTKKFLVLLNKVFQDHEFENFKEYLKK